jgi:nucleoside-diphosphate-sugar epimerase
LLGYPFNNAPGYVPIDENAPPTPEVVYALAKDLEEEMARQYCRWNPDQKMIGLRFSKVIDPSRPPASGTYGPISDARDGAEAVVRALGYDKPGFDNFVIANADTVMSRPSTELMAEFFPGPSSARRLKAAVSRRHRQPDRHASAVAWDGLTDWAATCQAMRKSS